MRLAFTEAAIGLCFFSRRFCRRHFDIRLTLGPGDFDQRRRVHQHDEQFQTMGYARAPDYKIHESSFHELVFADYVSVRGIVGGLEHAGFTVGHNYATDAANSSNWIGRVFTAPSETTSGSTTNWATNQTRLFLARIVINASGTNGTLQFWIDPDLANGEAGLGAAIYSKSGQDAFGDGLSGVRVSFEAAGSRLGELRIGNDPGRFYRVNGAGKPFLMKPKTSGGKFNFSFLPSQETIM